MFPVKIPRSGHRKLRAQALLAFRVITPLSPCRALMVSERERASGLLCRPSGEFLFFASHGNQRVREDAQSALVDVFGTDRVVHRCFGGNDVQVSQVDIPAVLIAAPIPHGVVASQPSRLSCLVGSYRLMSREDAGPVGNSRNVVLWLHPYPEHTVTQFATLFRTLVTRPYREPEGRSLEVFSAPNNAARRE